MKEVLGEDEDAAGLEQPEHVGEGTPEAVVVLDVEQHVERRHGAEPLPGDSLTSAPTSSCTKASPG